MSKVRPLSIKVVCNTATDNQNTSHILGTMYGLSYFIINTLIYYYLFTHEETGSEKLCDLPNIIAQL